MTETLTYATELAVGLACLAGAIAALRRQGVRWLGAVLLLAGASAATHAIARLTG